MKWSIVVDSSCNGSAVEETEGVGFEKVPFVIQIGGRDYVDDGALDVAGMVAAMEACPQVGQTACPPPAAWYECFRKADQVIAVTISSRLSGSYASALAARDMLLEEEPERNIFVLDSRSAGSALSLYVERARALIGRGLEFDAVVRELEGYARHRHTAFALASFQNLVKNGRVGRFAGLIAGKLGFWGLGAASPEGEIQVVGKVRGESRVIDSLVEGMRAHGFVGGTAVISHCQNEAAAVRLRDRVLGLWRDARVTLLPTGVKEMAGSSVRVVTICWS